MKSNDIKILDNGWMEVPFSYMAEHISKRVDPKYTDLDIYIGLEHIDPGSLKIKRYGKPEDVKGTKLIAQPGDIIFGKRRAYQGKVGVCEWNAIVSAHSMVLRPKEENIEIDFLKFFMQSEEFYNRSIQISEGSLSPTIKWKVLEQQRFLIPSKDDQIEIVEKISKLDDIIESKKVLIDNTIKYKNKLIKDIFNGKIDICEHDIYIELNKNKKKLKDVTNIKIGGTPARDVEEYWKPLSEEDSNTWVSIADLNGKYIHKTKEVISNEGVKNSNVKLLEKGTVIMSFKLSIGRVAIAQKQLYTNEAIAGFEIKDRSLSNEYLYYALQVLNFSRLADNAIKGVTLNKAKLEIMKIPVPYLELQNKIVDILTKVDEIIEKEMTNLKEYSNLKGRILNMKLKDK